jgi:hypothetical protein
MTATESKFTQQFEKLHDRIRVVGRAFGATRSASSIDSDDVGVMHGELNYSGAGCHAWAANTND